MRGGEGKRKNEEGGKEQLKNRVECVYIDMWSERSMTHLG